jgi:hypothetical protein
MTPWRRVLRLFALSPGPRKLLLVVVLIPVVLLGCLLLLLATNATAGESTLTDAEGLSLVTSFFLLPLMAALTGLAALREPRRPPKAVLWLLAAVLFLLAGGIMAALMLRDPDLTADVPAFFLLMMIAPIVLLITLPGIYRLLQVVPEIRAILNEETSERARCLIEARGALRFDELASATGIDPDEVDDFLDDLLQSGQLAGSMDAAQGWIYTAGWLAEKQRQLLEWVELRGHVRLDDLARLLEISPQMVTDWLYQLVQRGQFDGYANWTQGVIYAAAAGKIGADSQCPSCGGQLTAASGGRIVCQHCGTEAMISG